MVQSRCAPRCEVMHSGPSISYVGTRASSGRVFIAGRRYSQKTKGEDGVRCEKNCEAAH